MLSLSMIVRDEENYIGACLESVKEFVDEIVTVDTRSIDSTVSVAKKAGGKVEHFTWPGYFAKARNIALSLILISADFFADTKKSNGQCLTTL